MASPVVNPVPNSPASASGSNPVVTMASNNIAPATEANGATSTSGSPKQDVLPEIPHLSLDPSALDALHDLSVLPLSIDTTQATADAGTQKSHSEQAPQNGSHAASPKSSAQHTSQNGSHAASPKSPAQHTSQNGSHAASPKSPAQHTSQNGSHAASPKSPAVHTSQNGSKAASPQTSPHDSPNGASSKKCTSEYLHFEQVANDLYLKRQDTPSRHPTSVSAYAYCGAWAMAVARAELEAQDDTSGFLECPLDFKMRTLEICIELIDTHRSQACKDRIAAMLEVADTDADEKKVSESENFWSDQVMIIVNTLYGENMLAKAEACKAADPPRAEPKQKPAQLIIFVDNSGNDQTSYVTMTSDCPAEMPKLFVTLATSHYTGHARIIDPIDLHGAPSKYLEDDPRLLGLKSEDKFRSRLEGYKRDHHMLYFAHACKQGVEAYQRRVEYEKQHPGSVDPALLKNEVKITSDNSNPGPRKDNADASASVKHLNVGRFGVPGIKLEPEDEVAELFENFKPDDLKNWDSGHSDVYEDKRKRTAKGAPILSIEEKFMEAYRDDYKITGISHLAASHEEVGVPGGGSIGKKTQFVSFGEIKSNKKLHKRAAVNAILSGERQPKNNANGKGNFVSVFNSMLRLYDGSFVGMKPGLAVSPCYSVEIYFASMQVNPTMRFEFTLYDANDQKIHTFGLDFYFCKQREGENACISKFEQERHMPRYADGKLNKSEEVQVKLTLEVDHAVPWGIEEIFQDQELLDQVCGAGVPEHDRMPMILKMLSYVNPDDSPKKLEIISLLQNPTSDWSEDEKLPAFQMDPAQLALLDSLPGGTGFLLPSLHPKRFSYDQMRSNKGVPHDDTNNLCGRDREMKADAVYDPETGRLGDNPVPMVPQSVRGYYGSLDNYRIVAATHHYAAHLEQDAEIASFNSMKHYALFMHIDQNMVLINVKFANYLKLRVSGENELDIRLPAYTEVSVSYRVAAGPAAGLYSIPCYVSPQHCKIKDFGSDKTLVVAPSCPKALLDRIIQHEAVPMFEGKLRKPKPKSEDAGDNESDDEIKKAEESKKDAEHAEKRSAKLAKARKNVKVLVPSSSKTMSELLATLRSMKDKHFERWIGLVLNQLPNDLPKQDMYGIDLSEEDSAKADAVHQELLDCVDWNESQRAGHERSRNVTGGCQPFQGGPGCGKTLMQRKASIYQVKYGNKVMLICANNAGCDRLASSYLREEPEMAERVIRYNVSSRDLKATDKWQTPGGPEYSKGHDQVLNMAEFYTHMVLSKASEKFSTHKSECREMGLQQKLFNECAKPTADRRKLMMHWTEKTLDAVAENEKKEQRLAEKKAAAEKAFDGDNSTQSGFGESYNVGSIEPPDEDHISDDEDSDAEKPKQTTVKGGVFDTTKPRTNMYAHLTKCIKMVLDGTFDWKNLLNVAKLMEAYSNCICDMIDTGDIIITTAVTSRSHRLVRFWNRDKSEVAPFFDNDETRPEQVKKNVVVMIDEAMILQDTFAFMPLTAGYTTDGYGTRVVSLYLYGDTQQGGPVNVVSLGPCYNDFPGFGDQSLATRLIKNGFEHDFINEQKRMHEVIAEFTSTMFYKGKLLTHPSRKGELRVEDPALFKALCKISGTSEDRASDSDIRFQWIVVDGKRRKCPSTQSAVVLEAAVYYFRKLHSVLYEVFGDKFYDNVTIVCPYSETVKWWNDQIKTAQAIINRQLADQGKDLRGPSHFPRILSNDSCQGDQARVVILDAAHQDFSRIGQGFFKAGRVNVATSRAEDAIIILGNDCENTHINGKQWFAMNPALTSAYFYAVSVDAMTPSSENGYGKGAKIVPLSSIPRELMTTEELEEADTEPKNGDDGVFEMSGAQEFTSSVQESTSGAQEFTSGDDSGFASAAGASGTGDSSWAENTAAAEAAQANVGNNGWDEGEEVYGGKKATDSTKSAMMKNNKAHAGHSSWNTTTESANDSTTW